MNDNTTKKIRTRNKDHERRTKKNGSRINTNKYNKAPRIRTKNKGSIVRTRNQELRTKGLEPRPNLRSKELKLRLKKLELRTKESKPRTMKSKNQGPLKLHLSYNFFPHAFTNRQRAAQTGT